VLKAGQAGCRENTPCRDPEHIGVEGVGGQHFLELDDGLLDPVARARTKGRIGIAPGCSRLALQDLLQRPSSVVVSLYSTIKRVQIRSNSAG